MKKFYSIIAALAVATGMMAQTTKYVKVQEEPEDWSGTYLIVYEADDDNNQCFVFDGSLEELDVKNNFITASNDYQTINGNEVRTIDSTAETDAAVFTVSKAETEGIYYIVSASGCGIGYNKFDKDPETGADIEEPNMSCKKGKTYDNTIQMKTGKTSVVVTAKVGYELRFNADEGKTRFRYHASGKKESIKFYKKVTVDADGNVVNGIANITTTVNTNAYNLAGQRIDAQNANGIIIKNGKKYVK